MMAVQDDFQSHSGERSNLFTCFTRFFFVFCAVLPVVRKHSCSTDTLILCHSPLTFDGNQDCPQVLKRQLFAIHKCFTG